MLEKEKMEEKREALPLTVLAQSFLIFTDCVVLPRACNHNFMQLVFGVKHHKLPASMLVACAADS